MIDAHQHAWAYSAESFPWISDATPTLKRDCMPGDIQALQSALGLRGFVLVQARASEDETWWMLELAERDPRILGVVGWTDFCAPDIEARLERLGAQPKLVGLRPMIQDESDPRYMLRPEFLRGLKALAQTRLSFDLLIFASHLPVALEALPQAPGLRVILDHGAKPPVKSGVLEPWASQIRALAARPGTYCKASGLVTEADWKGWKAADLVPYWKVLFEAFGPERMVFGSDWPVCTLAADYEQVFGLLDGFVKAHYPGQRAAIFGGNAQSFYRL